MKKGYSTQEIEILGNNPNVKYICHDRLVLTFSFRVILYEAWESDPTSYALRKVFMEHGFDTRMLGSHYIGCVGKAFHRNGRPSAGKNRVYRKRDAYSTPAHTARLIQSGLFIPYGHGVSLTHEAVADLVGCPSERAIKGYFLSHGISLEVLGNARLRKICLQIERAKKPPEESCPGANEIQKLKGHLYVRTAYIKCFQLKDAFYNQACALSPWLSIDEILQLFEIDSSLLSKRKKQTVSYKLRSWTKNGSTQVEATGQSIRIQRNLMGMLEKIFEDGFSGMKEKVEAAAPSQKKALCQWFRDISQDSQFPYQVKWFLDRTGITKTSYYAMLGNDGYGQHAAEKAAQDEQDFEKIRQVMEHGGFGKGARQVYMMLPEITGEHFSLKKVRRLMKKFGVQQDIRSGCSPRKCAQQMLQKNRKPNLLKRKFRLHMPGEATLTDVTYLDYGAGKRAYGSAAIDSASGKLLAFNVSSSNDLALVMETLEGVGRHPHPEGSILHSDQGILYLSDAFQEKVKEMGMSQSMSKRGNCWDNAPQESFFGHFKDEVDYQNARDLEELLQKVQGYALYYNTERHQWNRLQMTPLQFEAYLLSMTEEQKAAYLQTEQEKYKEMQAKAAENAVRHARDLGV